MRGRYGTKPLNVFNRDRALDRIESELKALITARPYPSNDPQPALDAMNDLRAHVQWLWVDRSRAAPAAKTLVDVPVFLGKRTP